METLQYCGALVAKFNRKRRSVNFPCWGGGGGGGVLSFYFYIMKFGGYYFCRRLKNYYISQRRALYVVFLWKGKDMHFDHISSIVNILVFARTDEF